MKILVNALSGNGDALMFSPALRLLKENLPDSRIDMLVMFKSVGEMYYNNPFVDRIYFIDFLNQRKARSLAELRVLRKNNYHYSINIYPSNRFEYNFLNYLIGAEKRLSHHYNHTHYLRCEFFNTELVDEVNDEHNVLQNVKLVEKITDIKGEPGNLEIYLSDEDEVKTLEWLKKNNLSKKYLVGFHPGSSLLKNHIHKRWSKEKYAELGKKLMNEYNAKILLFGNEFELNDEINQLMNSEGLIASTKNYMDSMARMKHCKLFVSNDTAFLHSAAAFQIPTVGIFAYTNYKELYPWKTEHIIIRKDLECSPCFYNSPTPASCEWKGEEEFKCIETIQLEEVYEACKKLIQKVPHDSKP